MDQVNHKKTYHILITGSLDISNVYSFSTTNLCLWIKTPWGQDLRGQSDLGGLYFPWVTGSGGVGRFLFFYSSANSSQMFPKGISGVVLAFA
jgi:hypothetical protein